MIIPRTALLALVLSAATAAQPQVQISIGVRETGFGGGAFTSIGGNGGSSGGIEWINLDGQTLTLDGTWQQFTFNVTTDPITGFAGGSANGVIEGDYGTLEHVRVRNFNGVTEPISLWIDDVTNTVTPTGGPVSTNFGDFEGFASGTEVMFQEPTFSGSTSASIVAGATSGVDNLVASRSSSCRFNFQFVDGTTTRWVRLTTFNASNLPNPLIRFDDASVVTFWMRGGECQTDLGFQGPGTSITEFCGTGLNAGEASTYYLAGSPANAPGALFFSNPGQANLPIFGGTLVSAGGLILGVSISANGSGKLVIPVQGVATVANLVMQCVMLDLNAGQGLAFTNAIEAAFGQ